MPIYEYECQNCNTRFEKIQSITADPLIVCANCGGGPIRRVMQPVGIIFKGSGWYKTDNRKAESSAGSGSTTTSKSDKSDGAEKSDAGAGSAKSESTSTAPPPAADTSSE